MLSLENYPFSSRRLPVLARRGVVATSEPLAAQAGLRMLQLGGNAVDAAIATAIALTVVEPTCNGVGGDAFALVWDGGKLHALNGAGRALAAHAPETFARLGHARIPNRGWLPVTVPGVPAAWHDLHRRFGRLPFETLFEPAIAYAADGFPVAPVTALRWATNAQIYAAEANDDPALRPWRDTFTHDGRAPRAGDVFALPALARTLRELAGSGCESFYRGALAARTLSFSEATGGLLSARDLSAHESTWVDPIRTSYRGHDVWELPPSTQGIAALTALNILEGFDLARLGRSSIEGYHLQIEAIKLALGDAFGYVADPTFVDVPWQQRLSRAHAAERRGQIGDVALASVPSQPPRGGTVYLCAADADGMMVSFMQSNYSGWLLGFGSGVVVPETGIALHSRAAGFSLDPRHPNVIAPGKRPFHTLAPSFLTRDGQAIGPFGIMGGPVQPQGHVQFMVNQVDHGLNPQAVVDAPRFQWIAGTRVEVELGFPSEAMQGLLARGHEIHPCVEFAALPPQLTPGTLGTGALLRSGDFGKAQMIRRLDNGVYVAASDWRADGCAAGY
ncbi:MAG TPA: gamma-glutamyltransferase family protein [Polyangiaceae bacterium]|nr:gamma-glutamyltransferase family protein [Polyangiaceae bacterium]